MARYSKKQAEEGRRHVEDRRRSVGRGGGTKFGRGGMTAGRRPAGKTAAGGLGALLVAVIALLFGTNLTGGDGGGAFNVDAGGFGTATDVGDGNTVDPNAGEVEYFGALMDDTQDVWSALFENAGRQYEFTSLILYEDETSTEGCGIGRAAAGPFYCPAPQDKNVYIDLDALAGLQRNFGAPGDFAQAYIIAHEVGHHIQAITGISDQVRSLQEQNPNARNDLSVRQELQADCFAGVWGFYANQRSSTTEGVVLDPGDLDEAMVAAQAVGDDAIQSRAGYVDPHTFTHGTSKQRAKWFRQGFTTGDPDSCDTYSVATP